MIFLIYSLYYYVSESVYPWPFLVLYTKVINKWGSVVRTWQLSSVTLARPKISAPLRLEWIYDLGKTQKPQPQNTIQKAHFWGYIDEM